MFMVSRRRSGLLRGLLLASLFVSAATSAHSQAKATSSSRIDEVLRRAVAEKRVPGVVAMVAKGDAVVYHGAFGRQNDASEVPMATDSIFRIALPLGACRGRRARQFPAL